MEKNINTLIKKIKIGIRDNRNTGYFTDYIKQLSSITTFRAMTIKNNYFYRIRKASKDKLFLHTDNLKYPPSKFVKKGRFNRENQSIAYMSFGEIAPLTELDISYYKIYCNIKIKYIKKDIHFYRIGMKQKKENKNTINNFYRECIQSKDKKYYNFTIALGEHFFKGIKYGDYLLPSGLIYISVNNEKSNKDLYNLAITSDVFDNHCKIIEAEYQVISYDINKNMNIIDSLNKSQISNDGSIKWDLSLEDMLSLFYNKYSNRIFILNDKHIIHYLYGGGKIVKEERDYFSVIFPIGIKNIIKSKIINR